MKILIFQTMLKQYRLSLYVQLVERLRIEGHSVRLVFGSPTKTEKLKKDNVKLDSSNCFFLKSYWFFNNKIHYLNGALKHIIWADFIVTEQANKHIYNYLLIILYLLRKKRVAYWGHGRNLQGNPVSLKERIKKTLAIHSDWWFAYTKGVADYIEDLGFPKNRITILNNSTDTKQFRESIDSLGAEAIDRFRKRHDLGSSKKIGLYCGGLYKEKRISFLLEAACKIHKTIPSFNLLIVGDGPDREIVEKYVKQNAFIHYLGAVFGNDKALAFRCSDIFLCPGLVGLAILDSFAAGLPVYTTKNPSHGPEIEYLISEYNGKIFSPTIRDYSCEIIKDILDIEAITELSVNAHLTGLRYSIEMMSENYSEGFKNWITFCEK